MDAPWDMKSDPRMLLFLRLAALLLLGIVGCGDSKGDPCLIVGDCPETLTIRLVSGSNQAGMVGQILSNPIVVRVENQNGVGVSGLLVQLHATTGGGSFSPSSVTTNLQGEASSAWTLGSSVGTQTGRAFGSGISGEATFSASAEPAPNSLVVSPHFGVSQVGGTLSLAASVADILGNQVSNPDVTWTSRNASVGTVTAGGIVSLLSSGEAWVVATVSSFADSALVVGVSAGGVLLRSFQSEPVIVASAGLVVDVPILADLRFTSELLGSYLLSVGWNPAVLSYEGFTAGTFAAPTINADNAGRGALVMAAASAGGSTSEEEVLATLHFRVSGASGASGIVQITPSELTAAQTFSSLTGLTLVVDGVIVIR